MFGRIIGDLFTEEDIMVKIRASRVSLPTRKTRVTQ